MFWFDFGIHFMVLLKVFLIPKSIRKFVMEEWLASPQARKSGKNCYSFSIPLWFALKQSFFCRKNHTTRAFAFVGDSPFFYMKKTKKIL